MIILNLKKKFYKLYVYLLNFYLIPKKIYYKFICIKETFLINKNLKKFSNFGGVFDLRSFEGSFSIGDFIYYILILRYFSIQNKKIFFYIIKNEDKHKKVKLNFKEQKKFIDLFLQMSKVIVGNNLKRIEYLSWDKFEKKKLQNIYFPFKSYIYKRQDLRNYLTSIINPLLIKKSQKFLKKFLFNKRTFQKFKSKKNIKHEYITWHIRKAVTWSFRRNINVNEFLKVYYKINKKFTNFKIMIISDRKGCNFAKRISKKRKLDLKFCKDYSSSLFSDFHFILNSKCFISFKGGGVMSAAEFSKIPFISGWSMGIKNQLSNNRFFKFDKMFFWHDKKQLWINSSYLEHFLEGVDRY